MVNTPREAFVLIQDCSSQSLVDPRSGWLAGEAPRSGRTLNGNTFGVPTPFTPALDVVPLAPTTPDCATIGALGNCNSAGPGVSIRC